VIGAAGVGEAGDVPAGSTSLAEARSVDEARSVGVAAQPAINSTTGSRLAIRRPIVAGTDRQNPCHGHLIPGNSVANGEDESSGDATNWAKRGSAARDGAIAGACTTTRA
jgi:hypothetical protein